MKRSSCRGTAAAACFMAGALTLGSHPALAQTQSTAPTDTSGLQEVVVTAQFKSENVQLTPLAITAVSAQALADRGQTSLIDITQDAPSVQLAPTVGAFGPTMSAYIRGIGQSDLDPALEPGVGIYIDDVYFGTLTGSLMDLLDLDRVEVLRGPQGTLEGMNSEGGAIKLFSKSPDATDSSTFDLLAGSRAHVEIRASTNFAISDTLFLRLSGVGNSQDGYVERKDFGCAAGNFTATDINGVTGTYSVAPGFLGLNGCKLGELGGTDYAGGRAALRWVPTDRLEFNVIADFMNENEEPPAETLIYAGPGPLATPANPSLAATTSPALALETTNGHLLPYNSTLVPAMIPSSFYTSYATFCLPNVPNPVTIPGLGSSAGESAYCVDPKDTLQNWGGQLSAEWRPVDDWSVKNILADRGYSSSWVHDNDESSWPLDLGAESIEHHQFSDELRVTTSINHVLDLTFGGFYFREMSVYYGHEDLWYAVSAFPGIFNFFQDDPVLAHDKAGFLHATYHVTPKFDAIFGARYTAQDKEYNYVRLNPAGTTGGSATLVSSLNGTSSSYSATRADWRADLDYHFTDDIMGYTQYSTGFKGGGVDPRPFYVAQSIEFKPEDLATFETGLKTSWFDNHLRVNLDAYFSQYHDIQLTLANCSAIPSIAAASAAAGFNFGSPCALPYNAGDAHQKGVEFETQLRFGGFQADANFSWLRFNYTSIDSDTGIPISDVTPWTPSWSGSAGVQYTVPLGSSGSLTARLDGSVRSAVYTAAVNDPYNLLAGYTLYNAHLVWTPVKGKWTATLQVKNLTDKRYYQNEFDLVEAGQGTVGGVPGPPLEIDMEVKHTF
jgi:iron complex outermembrane recepter protein